MATVKSDTLHAASRRDMEMIQDARQDDSPVSGLISERSKEVSGAERTVTGSCSQSRNMKRSARASNKLRQSLAWDKAFSTDEGVLDVDELPLVTKTPRKVLELQPLDIPAILAEVSPGPLPVLENHNPNVRAVDRTEMITSSPVQSSRPLQSLLSGSPDSRTSETTLSSGRSLVVAPSKPDAKPSKMDRKKSASVSEKIVKADTLKGTLLRLPSSFTGKRGKSDMVPKPVSVPESNFLRRCKSSSSILSPSSASAALSKKVSAVSKKVKDTLGKVLPGSLGASAKHFKLKEDRVALQGQAVKTTHNPMGHRHDLTDDDIKSTRPASVENSKYMKKRDAKMESNNQEAIPTEQLGNGAIIPGLTGLSKGKVAGTPSKKGSDNQSFCSTKVNPGISRKNLGREGSQASPMENANHAHAAQSSKGASSGLRVPSPKLGFFDTPRSASGEHPNTLPERVSGSAVDTSSSMNLRKGLPPRPKQRLPSGRVEKPGADGNLAKVSSKRVSSAIPSAPHLRPLGKSAEGLGRSASAPNSPHKNYHGIRSSSSHQAVMGRRLPPQANSDQSQSCVSELRTRTLRNAASGASQNLIFESRDCESGQSLNSMESLEVDALPQVMGKPSGGSSTRHKQDVKFGNVGGGKVPSKLANLSVGSTKPAIELSLSGLLPSIVDDTRGVNENVFCRNNEGTTHNVSGELTVPSSVELLVDGAGHKLLPAVVERTLSSEFDRVSSAQSASAPFESCFGKEIFEKSIGHSFGENDFRSGEHHSEMANLNFGRSLGHDLRLKDDHEIEDPSRSSEVESSIHIGMSSCSKGKLILEDSPKATTSGNEELSRNSPKFEDSKMISSGRLDSEEQCQKLSISPARHPDKEFTKRNNDSSLDSSSTWLDWSLPVARNKLSSQPSLVQEHTPTTTPTFKRLSYTRTVTAESTQKNTPESYVRSSSPTPASDAHSTKYPLAVNPGVMNGISQRTCLTGSRKERNLQVDFDQSASESTSGQENKRCLDGHFGGAQLHKPKQRKSNSSHRLDQPEACGDLFSEERLRALEAAGEESFQKKSGAVQHSPPNKTSPNRNPWSPVKKGGQQPGPFDCTKKYTNSSMGQ